MKSWTVVLILVLFTSACSTTVRPVYVMKAQTGWQEERSSCGGPLGIYTREVLPDVIVRLGFSPGPRGGQATAVTFGIVNHAHERFEWSGAKVGVFLPPASFEELVLPTLEAPAAPPDSRNQQRPYPAVLPDLLLARIPLSDEVLNEFGLKLPDLLVGDQSIRFDRIDLELKQVRYLACVQ